ncbi:hypothetical protein LP416_30180 [Polaromonas sp. P2-4]|nr:hypothetical protein LP416_30180 [Polaromonas sp. P2-4]
MVPDHDVEHIAGADLVGLGHAKQALDVLPDIGGLGGTLLANQLGGDAEQRTGGRRIGGGPGRPGQGGGALGGDGIGIGLRVGADRAIPHGQARGVGAASEPCGAKDRSRPAQELQHEGARGTA